MNILFVCTGNTCRSPLAMGIFNELAKRANLLAHAVSRGISAWPAPAMENAIKAAKAYGADLSDHIASQVDEESIKLADRVYGMTKSHVRALISSFPQFQNKILPLCEEDIPDPYGGSLEMYEETAYRIHRCLEKVIRSISEASEEQ